MADTLRPRIPPPPLATGARISVTGGTCSVCRKPIRPGDASANSLTFPGSTFIRACS